MINKLELFNISYINKNIKSMNVFRSIFVIFLFFVLLSFILYVDEYYITKCIYKDNLLMIDVFINDIENITNNKTLVIDNYKYDYSVISISEDLYVLGDMNYKKVYIKIDETFINNEIVNIKIILGKESIVKVLFKKIFGKENYGT